MRERTLTSKQEGFAQCIADGMTQADAYRTAYSAGKMKPEAIWAMSSKLAADHKVAIRIAELRLALESKALWTREKSVQVLSEVADMGKAQERVAAVEELNSMHGFNAPTKHDVAVTFPRTINVIAGRA